MASGRNPSANSLRTRKGKFSTAFAGLVIVALMSGAGYLHVTDQWGVITSAADLQYQEWFESLVNDPDNEDLRAQLIAHVVDHYRDTPANKSLPLRNDEGQVIGRFRIDEAVVKQPFKDSTEPAKRRIFTVDLKGGGELWHPRGGRVAFTGSAFVTYQVDFHVEAWAAYAYFECMEIERARFECLHIDNILGQIFRGAVRSAGTQSLDECLRPGFTVIAKASGDTYLAQGRVGSEFTPRLGPYKEEDREHGFDTIHNDITLLHAEFRDFLGPIELFDGAELRVTLDTQPLNEGRSFGVDVYVLTEAQFAEFEKFYPHNMDELVKLESIEERIDMQKLNMSTDKLSGNVYILIDNTGWGSGRDATRRSQAGLVSYYIRARR